MNESPAPVDRDRAWEGDKEEVSRDGELSEREGC